MELAHLFLFMFENDSIVPSAGKSRLILDDLALEVIDHPVANSKMRGTDDIAQEIAAIVNRCQPAGIHVQLQPQARGKKFPDSEFPIPQFPDIIAQPNFRTLVIEMPYSCGFRFFSVTMFHLVPSLDWFHDLGRNFQDPIDFFLVRLRGTTFSYSQNHTV